LRPLALFGDGPATTPSTGTFGPGPDPARRAAGVPSRFRDADLILAGTAIPEGALALRSTRERSFTVSAATAADSRVSHRRTSSPGSS
jgi:hypothetical protein